MKYYTFLYGSGVLYGSDAIFSSLSPETGPSTGGGQFILLGANLEYTGSDDDFSGLGPLAAAWTDITSGVGATIAFGGPLDPNIKLTTGTPAGNVAGIESVAIFGDTQFETRVRIGALTSYPDVKANLYTMQLYIDANNHAEIAVNVYADHEVQLECTLTKGGAEAAYYQDVNWTTGLSTFKILRWGSTVYFYANGSLVFRSPQFVSTVAHYRFFNTNLSDTYSVVDTLLMSATNKTFAVFEDVPVHDTIVVGDSRIRGIIPPSVDSRGADAAYAGLVDVSVVAGTVATSTDAYDYYYVNSLTLLDSSQHGVKLSKRDDATVRTPDLENIGLGGGK